MRKSLNIGEDELINSAKVKLQKLKLEAWKQKSVHGYFLRKLDEISEDADMQQTWGWLQASTLTSEVESYICSLQDQEVNTKEAQKRHERNQAIKQTMDSRCRLCKKNEENLQHILGVCPVISSNLYLNARHNPVAEVIYNEILKQNDIENHNDHPVNVLVTENIDLWWDQKITTPTAVAHNKPDIVIWDKHEKTCTIIDVSVPLDMNITKKAKEKRDNYISLASELQRVYREYKFRVVPIIIGALGVIPKTLKSHLSELNFQPENINYIIKTCQKKALIGSLKVVKTFMKMS